MEGNPVQGLGRVLLLGGLFLAAVGALFLLAQKVPGLGRLPGDVVIRKDGFTLVLPVTTSILVSLLLTLLLNLVLRR